LHFDLGAASDIAACESAPRVSRPEGALATLASVSGVGERLIDGEGASVACTVAEGRVAEAGAAGSGVRVDDGAPLGFDVALLVESTEVRWRVVGRVATGASSTVRVEMQDVVFGSLVAQCEVVVETVIPGAAWLRDWQCPDVVLDGRPRIECSSDGGAIFENCGR
jgi:hypothetical protein